MMKAHNWQIEVSNHSTAGEFEFWFCKGCNANAGPVWSPHEIPPAPPLKTLIQGTAIDIPEDCDGAKAIIVRYHLDHIQWHRDPAASGWRSRAFLGHHELVVYDEGGWELRGPPHGCALAGGGESNAELGKRRVAKVYEALAMPLRGFDIQAALVRLREEYADVKEVYADHHGARAQEWVRQIQPAIDLGIRDEHDLRLLLAALGWVESCRAWGYVMGLEVA